MSFETIYIQRHYPIKNGYVQFPPALEKNRTAISEDDAMVLYPTATVSTLTLGSGKPTGSKFGAQRFLSMALELANQS